MRALLLCGLLLLAGCWTGGPFYQPADAVPAIPAGGYDFTFTEGPNAPRQNGVVQVAIRPDGLTTITEQSPEPGVATVMVLGFAPLPDSRDRFVAWIVRALHYDRSGGRNAYAVLVREANGTFRLSVPACVPGPTTEIAQAAGATPFRRQEDDLFDCRFPDHASLLAALRRFDADPPDIVEMLTFRPRD
ncbi:hypothetical protein [Sphingosinicella sp.]|uniref:hypothetical protein n=1 Tax=Sphingosinicella sp. TaxID=1917971 RepID=UPI004037C33A